VGVSSAIETCTKAGARGEGIVMAQVEVNGRDCPCEDSSSPAGGFGGTGKGVEDRGPLWREEKVSKRGGEGGEGAYRVEIAVLVLPSAPMLPLLPSRSPAVVSSLVVAR
jgi:hypothetical protein